MTGGSSGPSRDSGPRAGAQGSGATAQSSAASTSSSGFDVFISYARTVDGDFAPALQSALQRFAKPWYRVRSLRVFRDDGTLAASAGLWSSIVASLDGARFFVLLASKRAAKSEWVGKELERWLAHRGVEQLQLVVTDGDVVWDLAAGDFDWSRTTALPDALRGVFAEEPRYIDASWTRTHPRLSLDDPRFRELVADIAAPVRGRPKDELIGEHVRQHRRAVRLARAAIVTLTILLTAAIVAALLAVRASHRAEEQARIATSRQLAAEAEVALRTGRLDVALLDAVHANRLSPTPQARDALLSTLKGAPHVLRIHVVPRTPLAAFAADGATAALVGTDGRVRLWQVVAGRFADHPFPARAGPVSAAFDGAGRRIALGYPDAAVDVWPVHGNGRPLRLRSTWQPDVDPQYDRVMHVAFAAHADVLAWHGAGSRVGVRAGGRVLGLTAPIEVGEAPWDVTVSADGRLIAAVGGATDEIVVWPLARDGRAGGAPRVFSSAASVKDAISADLAFSPSDPTLLAVGGHDGTIRLWDAATLRSRGVVKGLRGLVSHLAFGANGTRLVAVDDDGTSVWNLLTRKQIGLTSPRFGDDLGVGGPSASGRFASAGSNGVVVTRAVYQRASQLALWTVRQRPNEELVAITDDVGIVRSKDGIRVRTRIAGSAPGVRLRGTEAVDYSGIAVSPDGNRVVAWNYSDIEPQLRIWRLDAPDDPIIRTGRWAAAGTVAFRDDGTVVVANADGEIWDPIARKRLATLRGVKSDGPPTFGPHAAVAVYTQGGRVALWNVESQTQLGSAHQAYGVAFNEDGSIVATYGGRSDRVEIWDTTTGRQARPPIETAGGTLLGYANDDKTVVVHLSPGATQALTSLDLRVYRIASEEVVEGLHNSPAMSFDVPDGQLMEAPSLGSGSVSLWTLDPTRWIAIACHIVGRDLSPAEWEARVGGAAPYGRACGRPARGSTPGQGRRSIRARP